MARVLRLARALTVAGSLGALPAAAQIPVTVPTAKKVVSTAPGAPSPLPVAPPPVPGGPPPTTPIAPAAPSKPAVTAPTPPPAAVGGVEQARRGVVLVERQGRVLALGAVLDGDGRILSALSPLGSGNFLSVRYADGTLAQLRLMHADRGWDLALLTPLSVAPAKKTGLKAARMPSVVDLQTFSLPVRPGGVGLTPATLKVASPLLGGDGALLRDAYELVSRAPPLGAPIVNTTGEVVAIVARACPAGSGPGCVPAPYAAPVGALKQFLQRAPSEATWLGVEGALEDGGAVKGVRVVAVSPDGPGAAAGLRPGREAALADVIVAVDGTPVATPGDLNEAVRARVLGDSIELLVYGMGRYRHVSVKPRPAPELTAVPSPTPGPPKPPPRNPYR